jgi:hypothetical protein
MLLRQKGSIAHYQSAAVVTTSYAILVTQSG